MYYFYIFRLFIGLIITFLLVSSILCVLSLSRDGSIYPKWIASYASFFTVFIAFLYGSKKIVQFIPKVGQLLTYIFPIIILLLTHFATMNLSQPMLGVANLVHLSAFFVMYLILLGFVRFVDG